MTKRTSAKYKLDRSMASVLLRPFGVSPRYIVLGLMLITAAFSMFMSNAATTATLLAAVLPVVARLDPDDRLRTGLILSIPVAANIGGIGTPVGTPPNAIAIGQLAASGVTIGFGKWMLMAVPAMSEPTVLADFSDPREIAAWRALHDTVMGGRSDGALVAGDAGAALFSGTISLENRGGFASVRGPIRRYSLAGCSGVAIEVRGDPRRFQLRFSSIPSSPNLFPTTTSIRAGGVDLQGPPVPPEVRSEGYRPCPPQPRISYSYRSSPLPFVTPTFFQEVQESLNVAGPLDFLSWV